MFEPVKIAPSILSADFMHLGRDIELIERAGAGYVHVDVMDGHFVPNLTMGVPVVKQLKKATDLPLDVHLMISNPLEQLPWFLDAGADSVTVHAEALDAEGLARAIAAIHAAGAAAAVSLKPRTAPGALAPVIADVDMVLVMSVEPGFSGQSYIEGSDAKVARIAEMARAVGAAPLIQVDGGIGVRTAPLVSAAGADVLVCGNAVFADADPAAALAAVTLLGSLGLMTACSGGDAAEPAVQAYVSPYDWSGLERSGDRLAFRQDGEVRSQLGVDVSDHQGAIDWNAVAGDGIDFAFVRVGNRGYTEGALYADARYAENIEGATSAGLNVGAYFFSQATSVEEAREEADFVLPGDARSVRPRARRGRGGTCEQRGSRDTHRLRPRVLRAPRAGRLRHDGLRQQRRHGALRPRRAGRAPRMVRRVRQRRAPRAVRLRHLAVHQRRHRGRHRHRRRPQLAPAARIAFAAAVRTCYTNAHFSLDS